MSTAVTLKTRDGGSHNYREARLFKGDFDNALFLHSNLYRFVITRLEAMHHVDSYMLGKTYLQKIKEISSRAVLVTIERAKTSLPSQEFLMRRFAMTAREAAVALLLARGGRNAAIAAELRISPHTARHHTESVLAKFGVRSREALRRAITEIPSS
jgi:DNA-binding CsgD family transcriptional regulator